MKRQTTVLLIAAGAAAGAALWFWTRRRLAAAQAQAAADGGSPPAGPVAAGASTAALAKPQQQEVAAAKQQQLLQQREEQEAAAAEARRVRLEAEQRRRASPLYRVSQNEMMVHEMLVRGSEGGLDFMEPAEPAAAVPARLAAGRRSPVGASAGGGTASSSSDGAGSAGPLPGAEEAAAAAEALQAARSTAVATVERAFFDALAEGLRRGNSAALASLLLDSRDQLAALLPQHPPPGGSSAGGGGGGEAHQLLAELREKLDAGYVAQRLQAWDVPFAAQCFGLLVHVISRLQAPARREATQAAFATVAAQFAAAVAAEAEPRPAAAPAASAAVAEPQAAPGHGRVHLRLSCSASSEAVAVQLAPAGAAAAGPTVDAGPQWRLQLVPSPGGDEVAAVLAPAEAASSPSEEPTASGGGGGSAIPEASVQAAVAAAQFMHHQLNELKADVAAARLAMLKEAILGDGSAIEYERQRYQRALQPPAGSGAAPAPADAFPLTRAWLGEVLQQAPPAPGLQGAAFTQAAVESGLLLLLQRPTAVSPADCPETLLLDLEGLVVLQNELQRLALVAASLLIVQQILVGQRALPPAGSPRHAALCERLVRRMGVLLAGASNLDALCLELHSQVNAELAAAAGSAGASAGGGAGAGGTAGSAAPPAPPELVELSVVRRMAERHFRTSDDVYRRVQAGIVAAATALLRSASGGTAAASRSSSSGSEAGGSPPAGTWQKVLRGVGAAELAPDVRRLAAALHRIAAVSAAVAGPVVYEPLLSELPERQRRRH